MWNNHYSIGVAKIDEQHKEIFKQVECLIDKASDIDLKNLLELIQQYITNHFADEERLMKEIGYKDYQTHKVIHESFKASLRRRIKRLDQLNTEEEINNYKIELAGYFSGWLVNHIMVEDSKLGAAVQEFAEAALQDISSKYK